MDLELRDYSFFLHVKYPLSSLFLLTRCLKSYSIRIFSSERANTLHGFRPTREGRVARFIGYVNFPQSVTTYGGA